MKYILLLAAALMVSVAAANAQGSLQFKQVKLIYDSPETVPSGHVWKIVSYWNSRATTTTSSNSTTCSNEAYQSPLFINSNYYHIRGGLATGSTSTVTMPGNTFPIWLPEGNSARTVCPEDFLTVIEFEIVP